MPSSSLQRKRSKSNQDEVQRQESETAPRKLSYDSQVKRQNGEITRLDFKSMVSRLCERITLSKLDLPCPVEYTGVLAFYLGV